MRNAMIKKGLLKEGVAPSYYIEGMLWNVHNNEYVATYAGTVLNCLTWLHHADRTQLLCAHQLRWLVRDGVTHSWPTANFDQYLKAAIKFWNDGG
jgi:hypothetical protein